MAFAIQVMQEAVLAAQEVVAALGAPKERTE